MIKISVIFSKILIGSHIKLLTIEITRIKNSFQNSEEIRVLAQPAAQWYSQKSSRSRGDAIY